MKELELAQAALQESYKRGFNDAIAQVQETHYIIPRDRLDQWAMGLGGLVEEFMGIIVPGNDDEVDEVEEEEYVPEPETYDSILADVPPPQPKRPGRKSAADPRSAAAARAAENAKPKPASVSPPPKRTQRSVPQPASKPRPAVSAKPQQPPPSPPNPRRARFTSEQEARFDAQAEKIALHGKSPVAWDKPAY